MSSMPPMYIRMWISKQLGMSLTATVYPEYLAHRSVRDLLDTALNYPAEFPQFLCSVNQ